MTKKQKTSILILEDDERDGDRIKKNLKSYGWEADLVVNSKEFKDAIDGKNYDLFIIDYDIVQDRGKKAMGGGDKALRLLQNNIGLTPVIVYSGNIKSEIDETPLIELGASFILQKGNKGAALSSLIERIISHSDEKLGQKIKAYLSNRLGEKTFFMKLISEERTKSNDKPTIKLTVEVQRLYDPKPIIYDLKLVRGDIVNARIKKN